MTAVILSADALFAASRNNNSSSMFSAGGGVDWIMKTSRPLIFSCSLIFSSPSAKRVIVDLLTGIPVVEEIFSAKARLALPVNNFMSLFIKPPYKMGKSLRVRMLEMNSEHFTFPNPCLYFSMSHCLALGREESNLRVRIQNPVSCH